jgi:1-acyl-sn-glycerol-3-phosphate acyltransferase
VRHRAARPTPIALRIVRSVRLGLHVIQGVATTLIVFPWIDLPRRREHIRRWSITMLRILRVETRFHDVPPGGLPGNLLIVANHISWLDIFVIHALQPARFIAKAELRRWPVLGWLSTSVGTLYVERARRRHASAVNSEAASALSRGDVVAIFPEGTTTDGMTMLPFKGSLLQPIVDAGGHVQPIAIRYRDASGLQSVAPAYAGDTTFVASFWNVTGERSLVAELHLAAVLPARARHRRELAREAEAAIRTVLAAMERGPAPDTRGDRRA